MPAWTRREVLGSAAALAATGQAPGRALYVRFQHSGRISYGRLEGDRVQPLAGDLFAGLRPTGRLLPLASVKLLYPCTPSKVLAVGRNYRSHLGSAPAPSRPELFYKPVSCLQHPEGPILLPPDAADAHYEGELVVILGCRCRRASPAEAAAAIFGYTCGNDVSERQWQNGPDRDLQWWRAKGADTFGPMGPAIATGLDPKRGLMLETRLNGQTVQKQSTADLLFDCVEIVRFASRYVTLEPGDAIFTGTPGTTRAMRAGDVVEVSIEGIGTLRNPVRAG
ncbi:MAG: fumarylacetoacetate hydrolase family protein [Bryobacteraceae bacterium]|nr:fumarylacetoacetate hydrolase family protein [Bryobacteraceae bacterium]